MPIPVCNEPICTVYTPDSILNRKSDFKAVFVGQRERYASCNSSVWFHQNYLAVNNLLGEHIRTYRFDIKTEELILFQELVDPSKSHFEVPAHLDVSPDGTLLALTTARVSGVNVYGISLEAHLITPEPIFRLLSSKDKHFFGAIHNVRFTPDGHYLAFVGSLIDCSRSR